MAEQGQEQGPEQTPRQQFKEYLTPSAGRKSGEADRIKPLLLKDENLTIFTEEWVQAIKLAKDAAELGSVMSLASDPHEDEELKNELRSKMLRMKPGAKNQFDNSLNYDYNNLFPFQLLPGYDIVRIALAEKAKQDRTLFPTIRKYSIVLIPERYRNSPEEEFIKELLRSRQLNPLPDNPPSVPIPNEVNLTTAVKEENKAPPPGYANIPGKLPEELQASGQPQISPEAQIPPQAPETATMTSLEKFEQPNPTIIPELEFLSNEKLGRRMMIGGKHVGQLLSSGDNVAVILLDNGLIMSTQQLDRINEQERYIQAFNTDKDIILPPSITRAELVKKLKTAKTISDDILGINRRAEATSNVTAECPKAMERFDKALELIDEKLMTRLPKNADQVAEMLASRHRSPEENL